MAIQIVSLREQNDRARWRILLSPVSVRYAHHQGGNALPRREPRSPKERRRSPTGARSPTKARSPSPQTPLPSHDHTHSPPVPIRYPHPRGRHVLPWREPRSPTGARSPTKARSPSPQPPLPIYDYTLSPCQALVIIFKSMAPVVHLQLLEFTCFGKTIKDR